MTGSFWLRKKRSYVLSLILVLLFCFFNDPGLLSGVAYATVVNRSSKAGAPLIILRLAHGEKLAHPTHIVAEEVAQEIRTKTNGRIAIEVYGNMQFGQEIELVKMVQKGTLDFAIVSAAALSSFAHAMNIWELPYLFNSDEQANQALDGEPGQYILKSLTESGLIGISYWENGFRSITTRDIQVKRPEDLYDLHIRVMQNPIDIAFFSKLHAVPTPMDWGEVIPTLKMGIIEGQESSIPIIYTNDLRKYQQYLTLSEHTFDPLVVLTGNSLHTKLSPTEMNMIFSLLQNARFRQRRLVVEHSKYYLAKIRSSRMTVIIPENDSFRRVGREFSKEALKLFDPTVRACFERYLQ
jgi:tripartite ATP-independent transporter DctP family solute receptor